MTELNIGRYRDRINSYKKTGNQIHIDRMRSNIEGGFYRSPSYFEVRVNGVRRDVHIVEGLEGNNFLLTRPTETIAVGDLVEWGEETHMCIGVRNNKVIQTHSEIQRCNEMMIWQDENLVTYRIPAILLDKTSVYSDGVSKKQYISIGTDQISMTVQSNEVTNKIPLDKRFIFSNDTNNIYKINRKDNILNKGLTLLVGKKDLYDSERDRLDLSIADYIDPLETPPVADPPVTTPEDGEETPPPNLVITGDRRLTIWDEKIEYSVDTELDVTWTLEPEGILRLEEPAESQDSNKSYVSPVGTSIIGESVLRAEATVDGQVVFGEITIELFYQ